MPLEYRPECFWSAARHVQGSLSHHCTCFSDGIWSIRSQHQTVLRGGGGGGGGGGARAPGGPPVPPPMFYGISLCTDFLMRKKLRVLPPNLDFNPLPTRFNFTEFLLTSMHLESMQHIKGEENK